MNSVTWVFHLNSLNIFCKHAVYVSSPCLLKGWVCLSWGQRHQWRKYQTFIAVVIFSLRPMHSKMHWSSSTCFYNACGAQVWLQQCLHEIWANAHWTQQEFFFQVLGIWDRVYSHGYFTLDNLTGISSNFFSYFFFPWHRNTIKDSGRHLKCNQWDIWHSTSKVCFN